MKTNDKTISIIELASQSNAYYHRALSLYKEGKQDQAEACIEAGNEHLLKASKIHLDLLSEDISLSLLLVHAEDQLISIQLYKSLMYEIRDVYKHFPPKEENELTSRNKHGLI